KNVIHSQNYCPTEVEGRRVRIHRDGSFSVSRISSKARDDLNARFVQLEPDRWLPSYAAKNLKDLESTFSGKIVYIVGKGPSLDLIEKLPIQDSPVICINEAIHKIEELEISNPIFV